MTRLHYKSEPQTQNHAQLAEAFGVYAGLDVTLFSGELPEVVPGEVVYITGESGSGKSSILRALGGENLVEVGSGELLADWDLGLVSAFGLGDAALYFTRYQDLSDSQQFRARLCKTVMSGVLDVRCDEFLSTLDRTTAKIVAFNTQKAIRRLGGSLIVATAHDDLKDALGATRTYKGRSFPSSWSVEESPSEASIPEVVYEWSTPQEYSRDSLGDLHYRGKHTGGIKEVVFAVIAGRRVGVLVGTYRRHDGGRRISRLVVHPTFRGSGVGRGLVQTYLKRFPTADTVAAMGAYHPVFTRAGMVEDGYSETKPPTKLRTTLESLNFEFKAWMDLNYCQSFARENTEALVEFAPAWTGLVAPGGKRMSAEELSEYLTRTPDVLGRVLWVSRPHSYPRFKGVSRA